MSKFDRKEDPLSAWQRRQIKRRVKLAIAIEITSRGSRKDLRRMRRHCRQADMSAGDGRIISQMTSSRAYRWEYAMARSEADFYDRAYY